MELAIESLRLKQIREGLQLTQAAFGQKLGISTTADIERARTKLSGVLVMQLLRDYRINPLWLYGESDQQYLNSDDREVLPQTISIDNTGQENILLVNEKAAAGYADNLGDPEYYESLPAFSLPLPEYRNATFRGFQVEGYSMLPALQPEEWLMTKALSNINEIKNGHIYVIVETGGIRVKKVINNTHNQSLSLISTNADYPTDTINYSQVKEIWEYYGKLTHELSFNTSNDDKLEAIYKDIQWMKGQMGE